VSLESYKSVVPPPRDLKKVIVVMPAYKAALTIKVTLDDIDQSQVHEIILVDDNSPDDTADVAESLGLTTIRHTDNKGYGGNQKTCYRSALEHGADIVVMIHPDYQYDARVLPAMVTFMQLGTCDVVLGSRIRTRHEALDGGMPLWKYLANRCLTFTENLVLGQNVGDFHTGLRAYTREVLETIPFEDNSDDFVFDTQFLVQAVRFGFKIGDVPVPARYFSEASSINFKRSARYGLGTLGMLGSFMLWKIGLSRSKLFRAAAKASQAATTTDS
jgi:glycosyltransferase involved in cell wall biosynthesis